MTQIPEEPLKHLLEGYEKREDLLGSNGLLSNLRTAVIECALELELTAQLGYNRHDPASGIRRPSDRPVRPGPEASTMSAPT